MPDTPEKITERTRLLIATDDQRRDALAQIISRIEELQGELHDLEAIATGHRQALEASARARAEGDEIFEDYAAERWEAELNTILRGDFLP